jgi:hypothetical protein
MNILIATGIYPPDIGGPAEYARQLFETLTIQNHEVGVLSYARLKNLPTGIRHLSYFFNLIVEGWEAEYIIALDTFSAALPAVAFARLFGRKIAVRVGGDFLWESYVERTHERVPLSQFYAVPRRYTLKERMVFRLTSWVLHKADAVVFSTEWQRAIWQGPYRLDASRTHIIENFYPACVPKDEQPDSGHKVFLSPSRDRFIKNKSNLEAAFADVKSRHPEAVLDDKVVSHEVLLEKIRKARAVIVASISEVSPNLVLDALQHCVPVIVTRDTGIAERIADSTIFVDPSSVSDIAQAIESLLDPAAYEVRVRAIAARTFTHSWNEIAQEFLDVYVKIQK